MKVFFLLCILFAGICLSGCRKNIIRTSEIIRRVQLKNTPDAVAGDFTAALSAGDVDQLCSLSTERVNNILYNELLLMYPDQTIEESLTDFSAVLKNNNKGKTFSGIILKDSGKNKVAIYSILETGKDPVTCSFFLVQDERGNWKNDTRL